MDDHESTADKIVTEKQKKKEKQRKKKNEGSLGINYFYLFQTFK